MKGAEHMKKLINTTKVMIVIAAVIAVISNHGIIRPAYAATFDSLPASIVETI